MNSLYSIAGERSCLPTTDPDKGWDGTNTRGNAMDQGYYLYLIKGVDFAGNKREYSGSFLLMR